MEEPTPSLTQQFQQSSGSFELVLSAVILGLVGLYFDRRFGFTPFLTVTLTIAGFIGAGCSVYYRYKARIDALNAESAELRSATRAAGGRS